MELKRREFLAGAAAVALTPLLPKIGKAQPLQKRLLAVYDAEKNRWYIPVPIEMRKKLGDALRIIPGHRLSNKDLQEVNPNNDTILASHVEGKSVILTAVSHSDHWEISVDNG